MSAFNNFGQFIMDIYTPKNPAEYNGENIYVRFANTNEIYSGRLTSLITETGATNSKYGYLYEIPLYYKNVYKGTLYYGCNTYGNIQNGGFIPAGEKTPIQLTLNSGYWKIPNVGNSTVFQDLCYFVNGVAQKGFQNIGEATYYFGEDGQAYLGTHIINGKEYVFSMEGKLISGVPPLKSINKLPMNIQLQKYSNSLWNMMHTKLKNGEILNVYIPQNPNNDSQEEMYSYTQVNGTKGKIIGSKIIVSGCFTNSGMETITSTNVKQNGQNIGMIAFEGGTDDGVQAVYTNSKTNQQQTVVFKPGFELS
ncbi:MAG: hypothetical protein ACRC57_09755 [Sarcina sp.]